MRVDPLLVDQPRSLLEITACIVLSEAYFGSSLHGMIAASSFGTRGMLVASRKDHKYAGFLDHSDLSSWLVESWDEAEQRADELSATPRRHWKNALAAARPALDEHWNQLRETLANHEKAPQNGERAAIERLQHIREDHSHNLQLFQPFLVEKLEETDANCIR